jgi:hypothetical protein
MHLSYSYGHHSRLSHCHYNRRDRRSHGRNHRRTLSAATTTAGRSRSRKLQVLRCETSEARWRTPGERRQTPDGDARRQTPDASREVWTFYTFSMMRAWRETISYVPNLLFTLDLPYLP